MVYPGRYGSPRQRYLSQSEIWLSQTEIWLSQAEISLPDRDMSLPDRDTSLPDRHMSLPERCVSFRQICLSARVMPFPDYPKSIISATNQVPVARLGPILSQDGATASRNLFKCLPGPPEAIFHRKIVNITQKPTTISHVLDA